MSESDNNRKISIVKAGVWYTAANIILKGVSVITLPFFSRIMSTEEYGIFSNYITWYGVVNIVTTFSLSSSLVSARHDFKEDLYAYCKTILLMGTLITSFFAIVAFFNINVVSGLIEISDSYILLIFISLLVAPATSIFLYILQYSYKYKKYAVISVALAILEAVLSLSFVLVMEDKVFARVIGNFLPTFFLSAVLYFYFLRRRGRPKAQYAKYALMISAPFVLHLLSNMLLAQSDRIMIMQICGAEETAIYSLSYSLSTIISVLWMSMNNAFSPFVGDCIYSGKHELTRKATTPYVIVFIVPVLLAMIVAPELIWLFGGEKYYESINNIPAIFLGCILQFFYSLYVNVEQYMKKTKMMAVATILAAVLNIVLNAIFIPIFGQIAAAYTTATGYAFLLLFHFLIVKKMGYSSLYEGKTIVLAIVTSIVFTVLCRLLYMNVLIRWSAIALLTVVVVVIAYKKKSVLLDIAKTIMRK